MDQNKTFCTQRSYPFTPKEIFAAFADPIRLSKWWGPKGFQNTFDVFEFKNNGQWIFTMHAPDGQKYLNHCIFDQIDFGKKIVIKHKVEPYFTLTLNLEFDGIQTELFWIQVFDDQDAANAMRQIVLKANEDNLDRLGQNLIG
jgi:uncharacterized protein YndB with AHSA1/START domain